MKDWNPRLMNGECSFIDHCNHETFNQYSGPALSWLNERDLDWKLMAVLQRWAVLHDPDFIRKIDGEVPLPPFEVPWSSREEFLSRAQELLQAYPDLGPLIRPFTRVGASA